MKAFPLIALSLCAGPLVAQDYTAQLDGRVVLFTETVRPSQFTIASTTAGDAKDQADPQTSIGVRFVGEIAGAPGFYYELGGRLDSSSSLVTAGNIGGGVTLDSTKLKVSYSYWMVGAAYLKNWGRFTLGTHLEARGEALRISGVYTVNGVTSSVGGEVGNTYLRPWIRLSGDYTFGSGRYRPLVGVEGAFALLRMSQDTINPPSSMDKRTVNSMAPRFSGGVYAGMRF